MPTRAHVWEMGWDYSVLLVSCLDFGSCFLRFFRILDHDFIDHDTSEGLL